MESADLAAVLGDYMLPLAGRLPEDVWVRAFLDAEETVTVLPFLAATCTQWRDAVHGLMQFAALRVAIADFGEVAGRGLARKNTRQRKRDVTLLFSLYDNAFSLLSRSWKLAANMPERLRCAPLADLSAAELQSLRRTLQDVWARTEIIVPDGVKLQLHSRKWMTPSHRAP